MTPETRDTVKVVVDSVGAPWWIVGLSLLAIIMLLIGLTTVMFGREEWRTSFWREKVQNLKDDRDRWIEKAEALMKQQARADRQPRRPK